MANWRFFFYSILVLLLLVGCLPRPAGQETPAAPLKNLTVFAAASLTEAFGEIKEVFEAANPGVVVTLNFASSAQLAQQLSQGAPADVFASADLQKMEIVAEAGRASGDDQQIFVRNRLVVIMPRENPAGIDQLSGLARPGLNLVLAAKEVPVGNYSLIFLSRASQDPKLGKDYQEDVLRNVVSYEENVKAVFSKVALGEADAGIVYTSDLARANREKVALLEIPEKLNVVAEYAITPLRDSTEPGLAQAFVNFVISPGGQEILIGFGFVPLGGG